METTSPPIPRLRAAINGLVITPDDPEYDDARTVFYGGIDRRPAVIARVADASDVSPVVSLARETGLELAVRRAATASSDTACPREGSCSISRRCGRWTSTLNDAPRGPSPG